MTRTSFIRAYRLAGACLILSAMPESPIRNWNESTFSLANFFSYFTILSNLLAAVVLLMAVFMPDCGSKEWFGYLRGAATLYMSMTFMVYALLLSEADALDRVTPDYTNWVMHRIVPVVVVLDWVIDPPRKPLPFRSALVWLVFPLLYLPYTLIRGEIVDWYPYPFIDPTRDGGYLRVALSCAGVAAGFIAMTWVLVWLANRLRSHAAQRGGSPGAVTAGSAG